MSPMMATSVILPAAETQIWGFRINKLINKTKPENKEEKKPQTNFLQPIFSTPRQIPSW